MNEESAFILLFVVATGVALAVRVVRVPYTVALVLAGLAIGALQLFPAPLLTKELLFSAFLPGLIFEAAFHIDGRQFRGSWIMIAALAVAHIAVRRRCWHHQRGIRILRGCAVAGSLGSDSHGRSRNVVCDLRCSHRHVCGDEGGLRIFLGIRGVRA